MQEFKMNYETSGTENYLCTEPLEEISTYQMNMLQNNKIPGLLDVYGSKLNGKYVLKYDITRLRRLKNVLEDGSLRGEETKHLLYNILLRMTETEQYFLNFSQCLLDVEYMYLDEKNEIKFVYLPFGGQGVTSQEEVRMFYQNLLTKYLTREKEVYADLLYYVAGTEFSLAGLMQRLEVGDGKAPVAQQQDRLAPPPAQNIRIPEPALVKPSTVKPQTEKEPEKPSNAKNGGFPVPGGGSIPIPGGGSMPIPGGGKVSEPPAKPPKEKKDSLFGGLFKKASEKNPEPVAVQTPQRQAAETPASAVQSSGSWKGTQFASGAAEKKEVTIMAGMSRGPILRHRGKEIEINKFPFTIGREGYNADYGIPSQAISRSGHATILEQGGKYYIRDENSTYHTYVNGTIIAPYTEVEISSGTVLRLANEEMTFEE